MANAASKFLSEIAGLYAAYFDAVQGFGLVHEQLVRLQHGAARQFGKSISELDQLPFIYGDGDPNAADARPMVKVPQGVVKSRNAKNSRNTHFLGQMLIVAIYQLWEDHYRALIATELGLRSKNELTNDLFGEIRRLRQAIIHNNGVMTLEGAARQSLRWFARGEGIDPSSDQMKQLLFLLTAELEELSRRSAA